jgi:uncharacterized protein (TIGR02466 family)
MVRSSYFATSITQSGIGDEELRARLESVCWLLEAEDEAGNAWCDAEGYDGYTSYASLDDLPERFPEFAALQLHLDAAAQRFADAAHWDLSAGKLELDAIWVNILGEGGSHSGHIHPGGVISGTYYVSVPPGSAQLRLEDPRLAMMMGAPPLKDDVPDPAKRFIYIDPAPSQALLWESWLRHEVMPHAAETPRISISFNYAYRRATVPVAD